jgi:hypothetical protein
MTRKLIAVLSLATLLLVGLCSQAASHSGKPPRGAIDANTQLCLKITLHPGEHTTVQYRMGAGIIQNSLFLYRGPDDTSPQELVRHTGDRTRGQVGNMPITNSSDRDQTYYFADWLVLPGDPILPTRTHQGSFWGQQDTSGIFVADPNAWVNGAVNYDMIAFVWYDKPDHS